MRKNDNANVIVQFSPIRQGEKATVLGKSLLAKAKIFAFSEIANVIVHEAISKKG
jgi:hypothetical protein